LNEPTSKKPYRNLEADFYVINIYPSLLSCTMYNNSMLVDFQVELCSVFMHVIYL